MSKTEKNTCPQLWEATIRADLTAEAESGMIPSFQRSWLNKPDSPKSSSLSIEAKLMGLPAEEEKKVEQEQSIFCTFDDLAAFALARAEQENQARAEHEREQESKAASHQPFTHHSPVQPEEIEDDCFARAVSRSEENIFGRTESRNRALAPMWPPVVVEQIDFSEHSVNDFNLLSMSTKRSEDEEFIFVDENKMAERRQSRSVSMGSLSIWSKIGRSLSVRKSSSAVQARQRPSPDDPSIRAAKKRVEGFGRTSGGLAGESLHYGKTIDELEKDLQAAFLEAQRSGFAVLTTPPKESSLVALKHKGRQLQKLFAGCVFNTGAELDLDEFVRQHHQRTYQYQHFQSV